MRNFSGMRTWEEEEEECNNYPNIVIFDINHFNQRVTKSVNVTAQ